MDSRVFCYCLAPVCFYRDTPQHINLRGEQRVNCLKKERHRAVSDGTDRPFPPKFYLVIKVHMLPPTGVAESLVKTLRGSEATEPFDVLHSNTKDLMGTGSANLIDVKG